MAGSERAGALFLFVYPFVTVGNGFRCGVPYLACSGALGALGIGSLLLFAPDWRPYGVLGAGVVLSHVLVTVYIGALRASESVRVWDTVARLGGDEFAVLLGRLPSADAAEAAAARIIHSSEEISSVDGHDVRISASVGIALLWSAAEHPRVDADGLLKCADEAMYRARYSGKGRFARIDLGSVNQTLAA